ncbi:MAG TPA: hypothetical protein VMY05_04775 [Acidobacteriota bacterium]|nr:hypothetical protein [Acidobacteriota bacterium]
MSIISPFALLGLTTFEWVAVYGAVVSTFAVVLTLWRVRRDRARILVTGMIGEMDVQILPCFTIANIGRRPICITDFAMGIQSAQEQSRLTLLDELPRKLSEGEQVTFTTSLNLFHLKPTESVKCIYALDASGKKHYMKGEHVRGLLKQYEDYAAEENGTHTHPPANST